MSVRLWLMEAECWQCSSRIQLSERDVEQLERLLASTPPAPKTQPIERQPSVRSVPVARPSPPLLAKPVVRVEKEPEVLAPPKQHFRRRRKSISIPFDLTSWLERAPSWLISLLLHLMVFLLLAILEGRPSAAPKIVLSVAISPERMEGDIASVAPSQENRFDFPIPMDWDFANLEVQRKLQEAMEMAAELNEESYDRDFQPQSLGTLRQKLSQPFQIENGVAARDVRLRREILEREGGTLLTEAAVARALEWFARYQQADGAWKLDHRAYGSGRGYISSDPAATALALLPFLGAGQTHRSGKYRENVRKGLEYLLALQEEDGDLRGGTDGEAGMYIHGQATIVLCESLAMTRDERLRDPARRAIDFITRAQHSAGGWRYHPGMAGDTSVLGWQVMALQSAKMAGLQVPDKYLAKASRYLDSASAGGGALFAYQPGHPPTANMTAEGLLCRWYLNGRSELTNIDRGLDMLLEQAMPTTESLDFYRLYYATQAFHHRGGDRWRLWNEATSRTLVGTQLSSGKNAGSWEVRGHLADSGGRLYVTALATCTLEVYYRHLPIFAPTPAN